MSHQLLFKKGRSRADDESQADDSLSTGPEVPNKSSHAARPFTTSGVVSGHVRTLQGSLFFLRK
jgi:hypothetical protein